MTRLFRRMQKKAALPPGTVEYFGEKKTERVRISVLDYDAAGVEEKELPDAEACRPYRDSKTVSWINVTGLHDTGLLTRLGTDYGVHPLVLEDIVHTQQQPKFEDHEDYLYIVVRMLSYEPEARRIRSEQVSLVVTPHTVLSFQEVEGDVFDPIRTRIRSGRGRIRTMGADYLAYAVLDAVVDHYFVVLERIGEEIESLEDGLVEKPDPAVLEAVHHLKREMILLRKSVWPLREVLAGLGRGESKLIRKGTHIFLRDVYDHTVQVIDAVESFRDILSGMQDLYLSSISNRMNEVMKVLTIIATVFIPLGFLAGIYGMNFEFMPELGWRWSYPVFWGVIVGIIGGMLAYFRKRRWI